MSASFQFHQTIGASPGTDTPQGIGASSNDWDFKRVDVAGPITDPASQGIYAGGFSMQVYIRGNFQQPTDGSPAWSSISGVKFYASDLNLSGCGTGAYVLSSSGIATYNFTPASTSKSGTWSPVPQVLANGINIGTAGLLAGTAGWTQWVGLQLKTVASGATTGYSSYSSYTIVYDEI